MNEAPRGSDQIRRSPASRELTGGRVDAGVASPLAAHEASGKSLLLSARPPAEKLRRLFELIGPALLGACRSRAIERAYLVDTDRLREQTLLRAVCGGPEKGAWNDWLLARVDAALDSIVRADQELVRNGEPGDPRHYEMLVDAFLIAEREALGATVRFNGLDQRTRETFFHLVIQPVPVHAALEAGLGPMEALLERLAVALLAIRGEGPGRETGSGSLGSPE